MTNSPIRVLVVDDAADHSRVAELLINAESDMVVVGKLDRADELRDTAKRLLADIVLLDLVMPGRDPIEALCELSVKHPESRVIICSSRDNQDLVDVTREAGAWGYFPKSKDISRLFSTIRKVAAGSPAW